MRTWIEQPVNLIVAKDKACRKQLSIVGYMNVPTLSGSTLCVPTTNGATLMELFVACNVYELLHLWP